MKTLVLDLDGTLVHSSFTPHQARKADLLVPVVIDKTESTVHVLLRPGAIHLCQTLSSCYEVVIFTASLKKYAEPLVKLLENSQNWCSHILYREHCSFNVELEAYVKDLSLLGRDLKDVIIVDNS